MKSVAPHKSAEPHCHCVSKLRNTYAIYEQCLKLFVVGIKHENNNMDNNNKLKIEKRNNKPKNALQIRVKNNNRSSSSSMITNQRIQRKFESRTTTTAAAAAAAWYDYKYSHDG